MTSSTLGRYDASPEPRERPSIARRPRPAITSTTNRAKCFSGSHSSTDGGIRKPVSRSTGRKFFMREKSGEQRKRISVSGFYPSPIRGVKSDRLLEPLPCPFDGEMTMQNANRLAFTVIWEADE